MRIEPPVMDDCEAIADLWVQLARGQRSHGSHLLAEENRALVRERVVRSVATAGVLVARDPEIVGFVMFGPEVGDYEQDVSRGVIQNLYVRPGRRGEGVGSALLEAAERRLVERGADVVSLEVMAGNEAAVRFYRRHDYRSHRIELEKRPDRDPPAGGDDAASESDTDSKGEE